jgi:DNA-binding NtrC family response regulator
MRRVRARLLGLAPLETPVLVVGEAGTGRDAAVAALHAVGSSARGSLRRIDCARFDVRAGVPTCSAVYLDGLEALTPAMQAYWGQQLREFARRRFRGVPRVLASASPDFGRPGPGPADPRLGDALMRFALTLPPLRERPEDVPDIADALVARLAEGMGRQARLTGAAHAFLREQRWHGNIRQLERLLERAVAFGGGGPIDREALGELMRDDESSVESIRGASALRERHALLEALEHRGGNISQTSIDLGKSRGAVYRLIEKYGIPLRDRR